MNTPILLKPGTPIPPGAIRVHFGTPETALIPRGSMAKNSLGETIVEKLLSSWDHWTDKKYGDNPHHDDLLNMLIEQAHAEFDAAIEVLRKKAEVAQSSSERTTFLVREIEINGSKPRR